ncbi:MAG: hypothetical protein IKO25_08970 [Clostridia bacterium]|nr:hypothetical protein [Clostridia bacterium]
MTLYLEKRGCDFSKDDEAARRESDLGNYRLFLEFIDKDGRRVCGDVQRRTIREDRWNEKKQTREWNKVISEYGLGIHWQYENYKGCYGYPLDPFGRFRKADVLRLVNSVSAVQYDAVEIVDTLPPAAHDYPESALALERIYLANDHAELFESMKQKVRENFISWKNAHDFSFRSMDPDEYKQLTLLAFQLMAEQYGIISTDIASAGTRLKPGCLIAHHMTKHFFEEQSIVDPYADESFLKELEILSPYYVGRYIR